MVEDRKPEVVVIDRSINGGPKGPELGTVLGVVLKDVVDPQTGVVDTKETARRRQITCIVYEAQTGALLHAGLNAIRRPEDGEIELLKAAETAAAEEFERIRDGMWSGGGRVVYTRV